MLLNKLRDEYVNVLVLLNKEADRTLSYYNNNDNKNNYNNNKLLLTRVLIRYTSIFHKALNTT